MKNPFYRFTKVSSFQKYSLEDSPAAKDNATELKALSLSIEKRLRGKEVAVLLKAFASRGGGESECVLFPNNESSEKRLVSEPQVVFFRVFRNPHVRNSKELKRLPCCQGNTGDGDSKICINPYHYAATVVSTEAVADKMSSKPFSIEKTADRGSSGFISSCTQSTFCSTDKSASPQPPCSLTSDHSLESKRANRWCSIGYWEQSKRVGHFFEGIADVINVFETLPVPSGFCLSDLNRTSDVPETTRKVRTCIGYGLQLSREADGIWVYNRSDYALFANGPTLCPPRTRHNIPVYKIPPGYCLKVYDFFAGSTPASEPQTVRISFVKGWGKAYNRPYVTCCPCWIEIHLGV